MNLYLLSLKQQIPMNTFEIESLVPNGTLLIIGGSENKGEEQPATKKAPDDFERLQILKKAIELTGKADPRVEIITTATTLSDEVFEEYKKAFGELGIKNIGHICHTTRSQVFTDEDLIKRTEKADVMFFAGGSQLKYTFIYGGTPFLTFLKHRYINDKIVIAGTSAGAMALSTPMIYAGNQEVQEIAGAIKVTTGLEFLKDVCIDTHFVHRGRFIRMAQVIVTNPTILGIGIEEDTAVIIRNGVQLEVVGTGTVIIMDGRNVTSANVESFEGNSTVSIRDLKIHVLCDKCPYTIAQINPPHI